MNQDEDAGLSTLLSPSILLGFACSPTSPSTATGATGTGATAPVLSLSWSKMKSLQDAAFGFGETSQQSPSPAPASLQSEFTLEFKDQSKSNTNASIPDYWEERIQFFEDWKHAYEQLSWRQRHVSKVKGTRRNRGRRITKAQIHAAAYKSVSLSRGGVFSDREEFKVWLKNTRYSYNQSLEKGRLKRSNNPGVYDRLQQSGVLTFQQRKFSTQSHRQ